MSVTRLLCVCALIAGPAIAQLEPERPLFELQWRVDEDGELRVWPDASAGGPQDLDRGPPDEIARWGAPFATSVEQDGHALCRGLSF